MSAPWSSGASKLHPVSGPGEDRNAFLEEIEIHVQGLHPVSGPGEDRNDRLPQPLRLMNRAAPGLRTG